MAVFDKLRGLGGSKTEEPEAEAESVRGGAPSGMVRSALSAAASTVLAGSKKAADVVLSRYRPALMLDAILDPTAIRSLTENRHIHTNIAREDLALLCTNSLLTLELAVELRAEVKEPKKRKAHSDGAAGQGVLQRP